MKKVSLILAGFLLVATVAFAEEQLDLSTPIVQPALSFYVVDAVVFDFRGNYISINLSGTNGELIDHAYEGDVAANLLRGLNKANFSVNSFKKTILNRLVADGVLTGTVSGIPD